MKFAADVAGSRFLLLAEVAKCLRLNPSVLGAKCTHWSARLNNFYFVLIAYQAMLAFL